MNRLIFFLLSIALPILSIAQSSQNLMYSSGRIYVVIGVLLIIFIGIILYIIRIDRKISKMKRGEN